MIFVMLLLPIGFLLYYSIVGKRDKEHGDGTFKLVSYINLFTVFWISELHLCLFAIFDVDHKKQCFNTFLFFLLVLKSVAAIVSFSWVVEYSLYKSILTVGLKRKDEGNAEDFELII